MLPALVALTSGASWMAGKRYLDRDEEWEPKHGSVLVHNRVARTRTTGQGTRGFRYWEQEPTSNIQPCSCGWRPEWGQHYRVIGSR
jgi:hypothetical protein